MEASTGVFITHIRTAEREPTPKPKRREMNKIREILEELSEKETERGNNMGMSFSDENIDQALSAIQQELVKILPDKKTLEESIEIIKQGESYQYPTPAEERYHINILIKAISDIHSKIMEITKP